MAPTNRNANRVGILGGGQLSLMLADAAVKMGLKPIVLAENSSAPAALAHPGAVFGSIEDENVLRCLFSQVHTVIFENEFVNCDQLKKVAAPFDVVFSPNLDVIELMQDKLNQKETLKRLNIATADYAILDLSSHLEPQLKTLFHDWKGHLVLKWSRMGYDGKGVLVIEDTPEDLAKAEAFCHAAARLKSRVYAERRINFKSELAMVATQSTQVGFLTYPLVISEQENGICSKVYGPAILFGVPAKLEKQAQESAKKLAQFTGLVGTFAIEFFQTAHDELLVNEIAPRVHNSGHYTQNSCPTDQFENHLRGVLGAPLGRVDTQTYFAMLNLLGPDTISHMKNVRVLPRPGARTHVHWYNKSEIRPRRKLGHLNGNVFQKAEVKDLFKELEDCRRKWVDSVTNERDH
ncbi:MAG: 5-(carboxyamino)imidazole ribonucleotide synthase [Bdellovibrionia bacterium]